jgi:hypothetical protein
MNTYKVVVRVVREFTVFRRSPDLESVVGSTEAEFTALEHEVADRDNFLFGVEATSAQTLSADEIEDLVEYCPSADLPSATITEVFERRPDLNGAVVTS